MITAVDSNVLLDIFGADPKFGRRSADALRRAVADGGLTACDVVWAEISAAFPTGAAAATALQSLGVGFSATDQAVAQRAGDAWRQYRLQGGERNRLIADFLVGAHALLTADTLLTRDPGFYRGRFRGLRIIDPSA